MRKRGHLLKINHNDKFIGLMNHFMPKCRAHRIELNSLPVLHTDYGY
jgi:predicted metal-dependent hydrolase